MEMFLAQLCRGQHVHQYLEVNKIIFLKLMDNKMVDQLHNLDYSVSWAHSNEIHFNTIKCKVAHLGIRKESYTCIM